MELQRPFLWIYIFEVVSKTLVKIAKRKGPLLSLFSKMIKSNLQASPQVSTPDFLPHEWMIPCEVIAEKEKKNSTFLQVSKYYSKHASYPDDWNTSFIKQTDSFPWRLSDLWGSLPLICNLQILATQNLKRETPCCCLHLKTEQLSHLTKKSPWCLWLLDSC